MDKQKEFEQISKNITGDSEDILNEEDERDELEKKKKAKILIIIEIALLLIVICLAIIFFISKNKNENSNYNYSKNSVNGDNISNNQTLNDSDLFQIDSSNPSLISDNNSDSTVEQDAENRRLFLPVPNQSMVSSEDQIPIGSVKILGLENGFSPSEFRVKAGEEITLALTSRIDYPVILTFYDETMPAISIGCGPNETRWVTFFAPEKTGRYLFKNDVFGKSNQIGVMIVE